MRRVLMICYYFPPLGGIGSLRALRQARHLPAEGWEPVVVAPRRGSYHLDPTLVFPADRVVRTRSLEPPGRARRGAAEPAGLPGRGAGRLRRFVRRVLQRPDAQIGWYPFALAAARRVLRETRVDALFSTSYPVTAHRLGRRLRRETGLPWVAEFRDLWLEFDEHGGRRRRLDEAEERGILADATAVVTVSPTYAEVLRARAAMHAAKTVEGITNGFDPEDFLGPEAPAPPHALYLGTFYPGIQDLETAVRALGLLAAASDPASLGLLFAGERPEGLLPVIAEAGMKDRTEWTGFEPHADSVRRLAAARVLVLAGPVSAARPALRGHIPAKVFEYLASLRPLLAVADPASDVARLVRPFPQARVVAPGDVAGAALFLRDLPPTPHADRRPPLEAFSSRFLAARLARLLDRVAP